MRVKSIAATPITAALVLAAVLIGFALAARARPAEIERAAREADHRAAGRGDAGAGAGRLRPPSPSLQADARGIGYRRGQTFAYEYEMDPDDLAEILKSVCAARENADVVIVAIHSHECSIGCDDPNQPLGAGVVRASVTAP